MITTRKTKLKKLIHHKWFVRGAVALLVAGLLSGIFALGYYFGGQRQKEADATNYKNSAQSSQKRVSTVGTVEKVSGSSVDVKDRAGNITTYVINGETDITGKDAKKTNVDAIKKDARVIVSGMGDGNQENTAQRIRLL